MITIHDVEQGGQKWHDMHDKLWTGSNALKLLQGKRLPVWGTFAGNNYTRRGKLLEHVAIREYEMQVDGEVLSVGFVTNSEFPNAGFSPDGIFGDTLLEVKCLNGERHVRLAAGDIPLEYQAQIHFGLVICELERAQLLAFNPEYPDQLTILDIAYDKVIGDNIRTRLDIASTLTS